MNATIVLVATAAAVVAADVSTKAAVLRLPQGGLGRKSLRLRVVHNRRAGIARLAPPVAFVAVAAVTAVAIALTVAAEAHRPAGVATLTTTGLGLAVGGAFGNAVDRLRRGAVVDFVVLGRWPVFNVADVALVAGVLVTCGSVLA